MRRILLVVFILAMMTVALAPSASAITVDPLKLHVTNKKKEPSGKTGQLKKKPVDHVPDVGKMIPPVEYVAVPGDTLTKIAEAHQTTVQRLWQKNTNLTNPDLLNIGDKLIIPTASELLADRPMVAPAATPPSSANRPVIPGNAYGYGFCTWHVKNLRPDLPNYLGDGNFWYDNAAAQGFSVGYTPKVGAVAAAVSYNHVAYVLAVDGNRVLVSEANYNGWNVISERWSDTSEWRYIY